MRDYTLSSPNSYFRVISLERIIVVDASTIYNGVDIDSIHYFIECDWSHSSSYLHAHLLNQFYLPASFHEEML